MNNITLAPFYKRIIAFLLDAAIVGFAVALFFRLFFTEIDAVLQQSAQLVVFIIYRVYFDFRFSGGFGMALVKINVNFEGKTNIKSCLIRQAHLFLFLALSIFEFISEHFQYAIVSTSLNFFFCAILLFNLTDISFCIIGKGKCIRDIMSNTNVVQQP